MTPDESNADDPDRPRFRERRSAFRDETVEEAAPAESPPTASERPASPASERPAPPIVERPASPTAEAPRPPTPEPADEPSPGGPDLAALESFDLPDPSFLEIVEILATQALQFLGDAPITERGDRAVFPRHAKHVIDLLGILEERTRGNLPDEEREYLTALLDELRTRYLRVAP